MKKSKRNWWLRSIAITVGAIAISISHVEWGIASFIVLMVMNHFLKITDHYEYDE